MGAHVNEEGTAIEWNVANIFNCLKIYSSRSDQCLMHVKLSNQLHIGPSPSHVAVAPRGQMGPLGRTREVLTTLAREKRYTLSPCTYSHIYSNKKLVNLGKSELDYAPVHNVLFCIR